ncbi:hypothetical protein PZA11_003793 [Diplocarpon coronariae]|nr:hypothetical protein JHW43_006663 [Diplocarpon mali]
MPPQLKPLLLPQLVEERRKRESMSDSDMDLLSASFYTQNSSASEIPSPVTPTFSSRGGHLRYPSSASSVDSLPASPTFIGTKPSKRSLPDVQEEPQEREEDFDMLDEVDDLYNCLCTGDSQQCLHREGTMAQSLGQLSSRQDLDYDLADGFFSDGEFSSTPRNKKRKGGEPTPLSGLATRLGTRLPSFPRKWIMRKGSCPAAPTSKEAPRENAAAVSRGASSRSSSISIPARQALEKSLEPQMPLTPTKSVSDVRDDAPAVVPLDIERANRDSRDHEEGLATTPLLPPLMTDVFAHAQKTPLQSPLQSPTVAEPSDPFAGSVPPIDAIDVLITTTPQLRGIPSPPLSTKPSVSSFHRSPASRPGPLVPAAEIPPIVIADPNDEWANKLGHANFVISPEPYLPETFDLEACRQLRANWDLARCNYTKHLVRTGEHYGVTSKTYKLTEEKWQATNATWDRNNQRTITNTVESGRDAFATLKHTTLGDGSSPNIMTTISSLSDPRSEGKFPQLGDEDIVGPMVQVAAQLQGAPSKKTKLLKFLAEKFPVGLGRS